MIIKTEHNIEDFNRAINLMDQMLSGEQPSLYSDGYMRTLQKYRYNIVKFANVSENNCQRVFMTMTEDECEDFNFCAGAAFILDVYDKFTVTHDYTEDLIKNKEEYLAKKETEKEEKRKVKMQDLEKTEQQWNAKIDAEILLGKRTSHDIAEEINCSVHAVAPRRKELQYREKAESSRDVAVEYINRRLAKADREDRSLAPFEIQLIHKYADKWGIKKDELSECVQNMCCLKDENNEG